MAYQPVELQRNGQVVIAETADDEAQLRWDGWLPTGVPVGATGGLDLRVSELVEDQTTATYRELAAGFVSSELLVIGPTRPTSPKPGTIYINNS